MARLEIDFLTEYDDESLLAELRRVAGATGSSTVTKADLKRLGRISHSALVRRVGSLRRALQLAGLKSDRFMKATDDELIAIIISLWQQVLEKDGRTPRKQDLKEYGFPVSDDTITRRFGTGERRSFGHTSQLLKNRFPMTCLPRQPARRGNVSHFPLGSDSLY
jgi:hypothetical protein